MKRRYYHKTVVVKDVFSGVLSYTLTVSSIVLLVVLLLSNLNVKPSHSYVMNAFDRIFYKEFTPKIKPKNIYEYFFNAIPLVKSSDEMMKKYEAYYGGVKKESLKKSENGFLNGKNTKVVDMSVSMYNIF